MPRRWISAAVGVVVGLALIAAPASARSAPATDVNLTLFASEVPEGTPLMGVIHVKTRVGKTWAPLSGAQLTLRVDGVVVGSVTTGADGLAPFSYPTAGVGEHKVKLKYAGDVLHKKAKVARKFTVTAGTTPTPPPDPPPDPPPPPPTEPPPPPPVQAAPGAPVIVIAEAPAPNLIYIEWTVPPSEGSPITGFRVYRGDASGAETFLLPKGASSISATDNRVTAGNTYYYVVTAVNANGESAWSNEVVVTAV